MFSYPVIIFALVLLFVILAMTLGFFLAFGLLVPDYNTFDSAMMQVAFIALGDTDLSTIQEVAPTFGAVIMFFAALFINLIMLNIFIAVIGNVYDDELKDANTDWENALTERIIDSKKTRLEWQAVLDGPRGFLQKVTSRTIDMFQQYRDDKQPTDKTDDILERIQEQIGALNKGVAGKKL